MLDEWGVVWVYLMVFALFAAFAVCVGWTISMILEWKERRRELRKPRS